MTTLPYETVAPRRAWLGAAFVALIWVQFLIGWILDIQSFAWFLSTMAVYLVVMILFGVWWLTRREFTWSERLIGIVGAVGIGILVAAMSTRAIRPMIFIAMLGIPLVLTAWAIWETLVTIYRVSRYRLMSLIACFAVVWGGFLLIRINGSQGNMRGDIHWRWTPTAEELYLANLGHIKTASTLPSAQALTLRAGDWPGFRGANRDGIVHGANISLDWQTAPPKVLWKQRVGPGWSSMTIVDGRLFTQEQRGEKESVVCRDAATGGEIWSHDDPVRFDEAMAGPGPRATPTFDNGRLYCQGARGLLNCLDATSGKLIWSRDISADAGAAVPMWGFCASPLIADGHVVVYAGGEGKKGLLAYPLDGGAPAWTADAGTMSYSSPQRFGFGNDGEILIFTAEGLFAVDESTGKSAWQFPIEKAVGVPPVLQACRTGTDSLVLGHGAGFGSADIQLVADHRSVTRKWTTQKMKPSFNDMLFHKGFLYGFDGTVFCCVDATTGQRRWREGRYGGGQAILLDDQEVIIVATEDGQAVLLRCNPDHNEELGRIEVIGGKTWNHPAVAQNRLFLRSDAEMACIELKR